MKKTNRATSVVLALLLIFTSSLPAFAAESDSTATKIGLQIGSPIMEINGKSEQMDEEGTVPVIQNGRTLLPVRAVVEAMGGSVEWNESARTATMSHGDTVIRMTIGETTAYVNDLPAALDVAPIIINGRTMLPIRFIAENFGFQVEWDNANRQVTISSAEKAIAAKPVKDLYDEFKPDVQSVSKKYEGADITVTGVVTYKGPDIHNTPSIELSDVSGGKSYVLVVVNSSSQLDEVAVGETVTMSGNFHIFGSDDWVVLKQGVILTNITKQPSPRANSKTLIVYYSLTNTTETVAKEIQAKTGADIYLLTPQTPYSPDHDTTVTDMTAERERGVIRELTGTLPDLSAYDTILIGSPVWSREPSNPVQKYLSLTDFGGKTVAGFWVAHANPGTYPDTFKSLVKNANVLDGLSLLEDDVVGGSVLSARVNDWLGALNLK